MRAHLLPALRMTLALAALTGVAYPALVTVAARAAFPRQASGSLVRDERGAVVGSALLGQAFTRAEYFHPRPSAAGSGYDAAASGATNLGPTSRKLLQGQSGSFVGVAQLVEAYRRENGLAADARVPVDAVTYSASGLDPDISSANARLQAPRVARARGLAVDQVLTMVQRHTQPRQLGLLGEPRVNVLLLNLALDKLAKR